MSILERSQRLILDVGETLRLRGIDAPELPTQAGGGPESSCARP